MLKNYYTVEQISETLGIHPKTVQRYIREGKLRATKIGKSWRVTGHDLSVFIEGNTGKAGGMEFQPTYSIIASSVIDIITIDKENAIRIMNTLTAALNSKPMEYGQSSMQCQFIERENMVRVTLWGDIHFMAIMIDTIAVLEEQNKEE